MARPIGGEAGPRPLACILPAGVASAEAFGDPEDAVLLPGESGLVAAAVDERRREFTTGRLCARRALAELGWAPVAIGRGRRGEPRWPPTVVGSITHCPGYRAAAVAPAAQLAALGIDAEPHAPLPRGVLEAVAGPGEAARLGDLVRRHPAVAWDRLLFSAKEAVYKAWFPLTGRSLGFDGADIALDPETGTFLARLTVPGPSVAGRDLAGIAGRWRVTDTLVLTATTVPAAPDGS